MLKNYLKIAWRNLFKHKGFSFINITGLALGMASCLLTNWLQNYAFRISIHPFFFIVPGLLVFLVAILTVTTQTLKAASMNPVKNLRTE